MNLDPISEKGMGVIILLYKIMDTIKEKIDLCINEWRRRLIDLTRRNRLIYFIPKRSSSLVEKGIFTKEEFLEMVKVANQDIKRKEVTK